MCLGKLTTSASHVSHFLRGLFYNNHIQYDSYHGMYLLAPCIELRDLSYENRLLQCGLTTPETRRLRGDQIEVFKIVNGYEYVDMNMCFLNLKKAIEPGWTRESTLSIDKPMASLSTCHLELVVWDGNLVESC